MCGQITLVEITVPITITVPPFKIIVILSACREVAIFAGNYQKESHICMNLGAVGSEGRCCCCWLVEWPGPRALTLIDAKLNSKLLFVSQQPQPYNLFQPLPGFCSLCSLLGFLSRHP